METKKRKLKYSNVKREEKKRNKLRSIKWTNYVIDGGYTMSNLSFFLWKKKTLERTIILFIINCKQKLNKLVL